MNIQGTNVTKEQLEASQRLGDALIAVAKVVYPETNAAISALVGCGVGILVDYTNGDVIETRRIIDNMIEIIVESMPKVGRALNGPDLKVVPDGNEEKAP